MLADLEEVLQTRDTWDHTYRFVLPTAQCGGYRVWDEPNVMPPATSRGLTGLELDITERRRIEDALQARRDEEHDRTVRTLLETATQGIVSAGRAWNARLCQSRGRGDVRLGRRRADRRNRSHA